MQARTVIKAALAVASLLILAQLAYWLGVRRYFVGLADAVAPVALFQPERVVAFPPGEFGLDGVRFALAGRDDLVLRADRLRLDSPDAVWLTRWLLGLHATAPDRLTVSVEGLRASPALLQRLRSFGGAVGLILPFEGIGCRDGQALTQGDYDALGWSVMRLDVELRFDHDPIAGHLDIGVRIDRDPPGVLQATLHFIDLSDQGLRWTPDLGGARLDRVELEYNEHGTLRRRNGRCSSADAGGSERFVARHLERLHAWLGTHGIVPDEPIWATYGAWLETGGPIHLVAEPAPGVPFAEYPQFAPEDRLRLLGISARMAGREPVPVEATAARGAIGTFRPLPPLSNIDPQQAFEPAPDSLLDSGEDVSDAQEAVAPAPSPDASPEAAAPPDVVITRIGFPELAMHLGRQVRISTVSGNRHSGVVLDATADAVELEIRRYSGGARLPIARDQISDIELIAIRTDQNG